MSLDDVASLHNLVTLALALAPTLALALALALAVRLPVRLSPSPNPIQVTVVDAASIFEQLGTVDTLVDRGWHEVDGRSP